MSEQPACADTYALTVIEEFQALEEEWLALYQVAEPRNPFLSFEWTSACWKENGRRATPFVVTARRDGRLVGVAPLRLERKSGFRVLRFMGDGRSDYLGFLQAPEHPGVGEALLTALRKHGARWDLAVLRQLGEPYSPLFGVALPAELRGRGVEGTIAPYLSHAGDWESLLAAGPSWLRRMRKEVRRFERFGGSASRCTGEEAAALIPDVARIEAASWKGRQRVGRFQSPASQDLLRRAFLGLAARGEMELWVAWMEGQPIAFEINFRTPERILLYQGAYREEAAPHSAGAVLDYLSIQHAWQTGAREYDFLAGNEAYKTERTTAERPIRYLAVFPASIRGYLAYGALVALRWRLKRYAPVRRVFRFWTGGRNLVREPAP